MSVLPLAIKAAVAAVLVVSIWRAFFGPPPAQRDVAVSRMWALTAIALYAGGVYGLVGESAGAPWLVASGVVAMCMAFWHAREDDDGGGGGGDSGDDTGPIDWDRFDRVRHDWDRPRTPA